MGPWLIPALLVAGLGAAVAFTLASESSGRFVDLNSVDAIKRFAEEMSTSEESPPRIVFFMYDENTQAIWEAFRDANLNALVIAVDANAMIDAVEAGVRVPGASFSPPQIERLKSDGLDEVPVVVMVQLDPGNPKSDSILATYSVSTAESESVEIQEPEPLEDARGNRVFVRFGRGGLPEILREIRSVLEEKPSTGRRHSRAVRTVRNRRVSVGAAMGALVR